MKFMKNNLKIIIAFLIGVILAGGIVYAATSASQVSYTREGTNINSVADALNDLYNKTNVRISLYDKQEDSCANWANSPNTLKLSSNVEPGKYIVILNGSRAHQYYDNDLTPVSITFNYNNAIKLYGNTYHKITSDNVANSCKLYSIFEAYYIEVNEITQIESEFFSQSNMTMVYNMDILKIVQD